MTVTRNRLGLRWATVGVVLLVVAIAIGGSIATNHAANSEEHNLLDERASELGLILTDSFSSLQSQLATVAAETALNGADKPAFLSAADALFPAMPGTSTALVRAADPAGPLDFVADTGAIPTSTPQAVTDLIHRALTVTPAATVSTVFGTGVGHTLGIAYPVGANNLVIYREIVIDPSAAGAASAQGQPFRELSVALYVGTRQDPATLVLTTGESAPLKGSVATAETPFGADNWLVAIKASTPLIGSFAANAYWLVLGGGLVLAAAMGALVEAVLRRRDYALVLVAERTAELSDSVVKLEETQELLLRQERLAAIGELASAVGHELRNPLGVITNAHYLMRQQLEQGGDERAARHLATAEREVGAATLIVSDLLDFARAREPVTAPVAVADLIAETLDVIPAPSGITATADVAPNCPPAQADRDQLRQVLLNLITNAFEAMPTEGGSVTIAAAPVDGMLQIRVTDTGAGMDEETASRVFEPFFTRKARGIGLGLAVTKRIVDSHGGSITVDSTPGNGATFTVLIPIADRGASA
jgi:signal transduction histidine kinase